MLIYFPISGGVISKTVDSPFHHLFRIFFYLFHDIQVIRTNVSTFRNIQERLTNGIKLIRNSVISFRDESNILL